MGLGRPKMAGGYSTLLESLKHQGLIDKAVFSIFLSGENDSTPSNLIIGGCDLETYSPDSDFTYVDVA
jgi:hypothetical protein